MSFPSLGSVFAIAIGITPVCAPAQQVPDGVSAGDWAGIRAAYGIENCNRYVRIDAFGVLPNNNGTALWSLPIPNHL